MANSTVLQTVESTLGSQDRQRSARIAHSVLYHFWRRLPKDERDKLFSTLPPETVKLIQDPKNPEEPPMTPDQYDRQGSIEYDYYEKFCGEVRKETGLEAGEEEEVIEAVFGALKSELPDAENVRIRDMLPKGLKESWAAAR